MAECRAPWGKGTNVTCCGNGVMQDNNVCDCLLGFLPPYCDSLWTDELGLGWTVVWISLEVLYLTIWMVSVTVTLETVKAAKGTRTTAVVSVVFTTLCAGCRAIYILLRGMSFPNSVASDFIFDLGTTCVIVALLTFTLFWAEVSSALNGAAKLLSPQKTRPYIIGISTLYIAITLVLAILVAVNVQSHVAAILNIVVTLIVTTGIMFYSIRASNRLFKLLEYGTSGSGSFGGQSNKRLATGVRKMTGFMRKAVATNVFMTLTLILYIALDGTRKPFIYIVFMPIHRVLDQVIMCLILFMLRPQNNAAAFKFSLRHISTTITSQLRSKSAVHSEISTTRLSSTN